MKKDIDIKVILIIQVVLLIIEGILLYILEKIPDVSSYGFAAIFSWEMILSIIIAIIIGLIAIEFAGATLLLIIFLIKKLITKIKK